MSGQQVCLYQWDNMINCYENENYIDKIDYINKTYRGQDVDIETNIVSVSYPMKYHIQNDQRL